ncbi:MAG TPA: hypothetical protein DD727_03775 [Clostridiales bacterium]|nr:hypothetical protein [Clostridiales bacterium]
MWVDAYEKLNHSEREEYRRLLSLLLAKTFLLRDVFDAREGMMKVSPEYRFVERNFELFSEYLAFGGWEIRKDSQYGVISLENAYEYNRIRLDRITTLFLYTLRLIYEEEREKVTLRNEIMVQTGQLIHKMLSLNIIRKKPPDRDLASGLRQLGDFNIIQKIAGNWQDPETRFLVLPSILFVVTNERISRMHELLQNAGEEAPEGTGPEADTAEVPDPIRGEEDDME